MNDKDSISVESLINWVEDGKPDSELTENASSLKCRLASRSYLFEPLDVSLTLNLLTEKGYSWSLVSTSRGIRYRVYKLGYPCINAPTRVAKSLPGAVFDIMRQVISMYECNDSGHALKKNTLLRLKKLFTIANSGKRFTPQYSLKHLHPDELDEIINLPVESTVLVRDKGEMTRVW